MLCKFIYAAYRNMTKHTLISYELCEKNIILVQIPMFYCWNEWKSGTFILKFIECKDDKNRRINQI